jgi:SAM-dependent methyltransferase
LPAYLQYSNACIIPFKIDNITVFVNPLKVYEYLAMRKPVISTDIAELRNIPGVMIATDSDDFICNIRKAIEHTHSFDGIEEYLKLNNWGSRVKKIEDLLSGIESKTLDISDIQGSEDRSVRPKRSLDFNDKYAAYLRILQEVQEEITSLTTCPFYADFQKGKDYCGKEVCFPPYRDAEIYYWENIPKWIYEDSKSNTIRNCLDIGCSYGTLSLFTKKVAGCDSFLIDFIDVYISSKLVDKYNFNFFVNNIELDEFPVKLRFDAIIFTEILEHLNFHPVPTLKKLRALLNDNGRIYMSTPDAAEHGKVQEFYNSYKEMPCPKKGSKVIDTHIYQYNKEELFSIIDEADFKIERFDYARGLGARHFNLILQKK